MSAAILSIIALVVGALLQHFLGRQSTRSKHLLESRDRAYTDFCRSFAQLIAIQRIGNQDAEFEHIALINDAKIRICMYGEEQIVHRLESFHADGVRHESKEEMEALTQFYLAIRQSLGIEDQKSVHDAIYHSLSPRHGSGS